MAFGIHESGLQIAVGKAAQSDYKTATAATTPTLAYVEQVMTSKNFISKTVEKLNNKGNSTGNRFANDSWNGKHSTSFSMPFHVSFQNIPRYLLAVMGSLTSTAAAGLYSHLAKFLDVRAATDLPVYTIIEQASPGNGGLNRKAPSMTGKSLKISGDGGARCSGVVEWLGSGELVAPSGIAWATHVEATQGTQDFVYNTTSKLARSDAPGGGNAVNRSLCENLGWEINIVNNFAEDDYGCARLFDPTNVKKGILRSHLPVIDTEVSSRWKFKLPQNSTEMSLLENDAALKLFFSLLSTETLAAGSKVMNFDMPLNKYKVVEHSAENGFVYVTIEPDTLFSNAAGKILEVETINDVTAYA